MHGDAAVCGWYCGSHCCHMATHSIFVNIIEPYGYIILRFFTSSLKYHNCPVIYISSSSFIVFFMWNGNNIR